jgi:DNA-binding NarL/FixJ family response regulator
MKPIRVMLADDNDLVLDILSAAITSDPSIDLVGAARETSEAVELARTQGPDVAVVDVRIPGGGGTSVARGVRMLSPGTRVIAFSGDDDPDVVSEMLRAGAVGYVSKEEGLESVMQAIHRSMEGSDSSPKPQGSNGREDTNDRVLDRDRRPIIESL